MTDCKSEVNLSNVFESLGQAAYDYYRYTHNTYICGWSHLDETRQMEWNDLAAFVINADKKGLIKPKPKSAGEAAFNSYFTSSQGPEWNSRTWDSVGETIRNIWEDLAKSARDYQE